MRIDRIEELKPTTQKSYYGKAQLLYDDTIGVVWLKSYDTIVCGVYNGVFLRCWSGYSATTMKHINDFRLMMNMKKMTKKEWLEDFISFNKVLINNHNEIDIIRY